jgi:FkbH-like protein/non-ribosomal peptide synthase protein (TIGR01720 family)
VLGVERVGVEDDFFELGGDSIMAIQVAARLNRHGYRLLPKQIFEKQTIAAICAELAEDRSIEIDQAPVTGRFDLTPIQRRFFELHPEGNSHFNQAMCMRPHADLGWDQLATIMATLLYHHDGLRSRFFCDEAGRWWQQIPAAGDALPMMLVDLSQLPKSLRPSTAHHIEGAMQASLALDGPLMRVVGILEQTESPPILVWCMHHLLVDGVSWRVLLDDINILGSQLLTGQAPALPVKTISTGDWVEALQMYADSPVASAELPHWLTRLDGSPTKPTLALGTDQRSVQGELDADSTHTLLKELPGRYHCKIGDLLLAALSIAIGRWQDCVAVDVELEGHGRELPESELDSSRTVGWFTSRYPLRLPALVGAAVAQVQTTKEAIQAIPHRGIGYGALRYLASDAAIREQMNLLPEPEIGFNYLGQIGQVDAEQAVFEVLPDMVANLHGQQTLRAQHLSFSGVVTNGILCLSLAYDSVRYDAKRADELLSLYVSALHEIIEAGLALERTPHTPSDFPESGLDQSELDSLLKGRPPVEAIYPLSPLQEGMLFETRMKPGAGVNTLQLDAAINGAVDISVLHQAWLDVVHRHPILRTCFDGLVDEQPRQLVLRDTVLDWSVHDWREQRSDSQASRLSSFLEEDRCKPFDLEHGIAMRIQLIRLDETHYRMVWTRHHALVDGWSSAIVLREVIEIYAHRLHGVSADLPPAKSYRDYIRWLSVMQHGGEAEQWWRSYLAGFDSPNTLISDRQWHRHISNARASEHTHVLDADLSSTLKAFAKANKITPSVLFQAAWGALLKSICGSDDIVFGTVGSGRPAQLEGIETIVGPLINTLPIRLQFDNNDTAQWLSDLQRDMLERDQVSHLPLPRIQQLAGVLGGTPLFESLLVVQNYVTETQRRELVSERERVEFDIDSGETAYKINYPLTAFITLAEQHSVRFCYDPAFFSHDVIVDFGQRIDRFLNLLVSQGLEAVRQDADAISETALPTEQAPVMARMRFHHIGVACTDIDEGLAFVSGQFDIAAISERVYDQLQQAELCIIETHNGTRIELVAGLQVQGLLARGVTLYHTCFEVDDLEAEIKSACMRGAAIVVEPRPAVLFGGRRVAFLQSPIGLMELLESQSVNHTPSDERPAASAKLTIVATFTIDPLRDALSHIFKVAKWPVQVEPAPYAQVFQQLLDPQSALRQNDNGANLILLRWEDWLGGRSDDTVDESVFERNFEQFSDALSNLVRPAGVPLFLLLAPPSPRTLESPAAREFHLAQRERLNDVVDSMPGVHLMLGEAILRQYQLTDYFDADTEQVAHIPFTPEAYALLALGVVREWHRLSRPPVKVVVVDCDDTLWTGTVAEAGVEGIAITPARLALQDRLITLQKAGVLICLCSRNIEQDVLAVFEGRSEMKLQRNHLVAWRINWESKSDNIRSLAAELDLGLDSFVFIDDDHVQCAQMRTYCPSVTTLQIPDDERLIEDFVRHCWALDAGSSTLEGQQRTIFYRANLQRSHEQSKAPSLREFIDSLELKIEIDATLADDYARVAELSARTNQFNLTRRRYSEADLASRIGNHSLGALSIRLADRFGDYGLVGVVLYAQEEQVLSVENMLLSCRALGRGVEHRMLVELASIALELNCISLSLAYVPSERSQPIADFLSMNFDEFAEVDTDRITYTVPAQQARKLKWKMSETAANTEDRRVSIEANSAHAKTDTRGHPDYVAIAKEVADLDALSTAIRLSTLPTARALKPYEEPIDEYEEWVASIWADLLGMPKLGRADHFFELGGHSLIATRLIARCRQSYQIEVPLARIFDAPTVKEFAETVKLLVWSRSAAEATADEVHADTEEGFL